MGTSPTEPKDGHGPCLSCSTIAAFCVILNADNSLESREQILFCRNTLSASYAADVILQQKQMEAALVSLTIRLGTTIIDSYNNRCAQYVVRRRHRCGDGAYRHASNS
jgi:hypothetical protein